MVPVPGAPGADIAVEEFFEASGEDALTAVFDEGAKTPVLVAAMILATAAIKPAIAVMKPDTPDNHDDFGASAIACPPKLRRRYA